MMMDLQELLARIEAITAKDVEVGQVLRDIVLHIARLERATSKPSKEAK
jgi:hypothetical protein